MFVVWTFSDKGLLLFTKMRPLLWGNRLPWKLPKTPYISSLLSYISKMKSVTPIFLLLNSNQQSELVVSAKFEKIHGSWFRATLNFPKMRQSDCALSSAHNAKSPIDLDIVMKWNLDRSSHSDIKQSSWKQIWKNPGLNEIRTAHDLAPIVLHCCTNLAYL